MTSLTLTKYSRCGVPANQTGILLLWIAMAMPRVAAQGVAQVDVSQFGIDVLANTEITSVSRKEESLFRAAAAVYVITQEDIRRSGVDSIPEALRLAPGVTVAQIDANQWAITSRGFNERLADKMLVLLDGRALYTPLSSGVYWDIQDTTLEDIERIEVIRGPGATLWGANAVNGVVNIITKKTSDTQGTLLMGTGGSEGGSGGARYGGKLGDRGTYRLFTKYMNRTGFTDSLGRRAPDDWHLIRAGFRADLRLSGRDDLTVQGDIYKGNEGQTVPGLLSLTPPESGTFVDRSNVSGGNVLARWHRASSSRLDTTLQGYAEVTDRSQLGLLGEYRHTVDVEFEQHFVSGSRNDLVWGADYRGTADRTVGSLNISFSPIGLGTNLYGVFVQDQITVLPDRLKITLGSKLEHNYFSGWALQPNIRLLWELGPNATVWSAVSRASENSSRTDANIRVNETAFTDASGKVNLVSNFGTPGLPPENVVAYELGARRQVGKGLSLDLAVFYNHYTNRHTHEPAPSFVEETPEPTHIVLPTITASNISGETHGVELSGKWKILSNWSLSSSYSFFEIHLHAKNSLDVSTTGDSEGSSPRHEFQVRSELNLPHHFEFDNAVYYMGQLVGPQVPAYTRVDARLGWKGSESWELSVGLQNLLTPRHFEFGSGDFLQATQVGRGAYGKFTWRF